MLDTIYLDQDTWDLALDVNRNIALANAPYSVAQDAASASRLWLGEALYDTTQGIDYAQTLLGQLPPINVVSSMYDQASQTVPDVVLANTSLLYNASSRTLTGQINLTLSNSISINVSI